MVEELLELLIGVVDAELLKGVGLSWEGGREGGREEVSQICNHVRIICICDLPVVEVF